MKILNILLIVGTSVFLFSCVAITERAFVDDPSIVATEICRDEINDLSSKSVIPFNYSPIDLVGFGKSNARIFRVGTDSLYLTSVGQNCGKLVNFGGKIKSIETPSGPIYTGEDVPFSADIERRVDVEAAQCQENKQKLTENLDFDSSDLYSPVLEPTSRCSFILLENTVQLVVNSLARRTSVFSFYDNLFIW